MQNVVRLLRSTRPQTENVCVPTKTKRRRIFFVAGALKYLIRIWSRYGHARLFIRTDGECSAFATKSHRLRTVDTQKCTRLAKQNICVFFCRWRMLCVSYEKYDARVRCPRTLFLKAACFKARAPAVINSKILRNCCVCEQKPTGAPAHWKKHAFVHKLCIMNVAHQNDVGLLRKMRWHTQKSTRLPRNKCGARHVRIEAPLANVFLFKLIIY